MTRYFIKFSYLGTLYSGMQKNIVKNTNIQIYDIDTIQGAIENAFSTLIPKCVVWPRLTCCSRTDHGVHAIYNLAHIDVKNKYGSIYNPDTVLRNANRYLINCGHNIRVLEAIPVKNTFHVRRCANSRTYLYRVLRAKNKNDHKIPIIEMNHCLHLKSDTFDPERIKRGIQLFMGTKDFRTFSAKTISNRPIKYVRNLCSLTFEKGSPLMPFDPLSENFEFWEFKCSAKSFVYKQVRRIVSTLIALGTGQITEKDIVVMLQVPGHHNFLPILRAAPSNGLYLLDVGYNQEYLDEHIIKYKISDNEIVIPLDETEYLQSILTMDLNSLVRSKKLQLKKCKTIVTNTLGQKYVEIDGINTELSSTATPFVIDDRPDLHIAHVIQGLFLSSQDPVVSKEILQKRKIRHVLSIGIDASVKFDDIKYYYCDLLDLPESDLLVAIKKCIKIIHEHRDENILVHCNAGVSRSPAIVISYIMAYDKVSYDDAYNKVKSVRSCIKPNEGFVQQLKKAQLLNIL